MSYRKRPCRVCGKWYRPSPRGGYRQVTCGESACKRAWHVKTCRKWREANPEYPTENRLGPKLDTVAKGQNVRDPCPELRYPRNLAAESLGARGGLLVHFVLAQLLRLVREGIERYPTGNRRVGRKVPVRGLREQAMSEVTGNMADKGKVLCRRSREQIASEAAPGLSCRGHENDREAPHRD